MSLIPAYQQHLSISYVPVRILIKILHSFRFRSFVNTFIVPPGHFGANGTQVIPPNVADQIPAIAFQIPDIAAQAKLELISQDDNSTIGCVQSQVTNGKTVNVPAVSYIAAGVAAGALVLGGASAISAAVSGAAAGAGSSVGGVGTISPTFGEVFGVFHGFALNGMMSAQLPQVYRSFSKNFAFSTGLIPWREMQIGIGKISRNHFLLVLITFRSRLFSVGPSKTLIYLNLNGDG